MDRATYWRRIWKIRSKSPAGDSSLARRLAEEDLVPFLDKWHLVPGEPWQEALERALQASRSCAVFLGAELGPWQNEQMRVALGERVHDADFRVIPVLLPGATEPEKEGLPLFLRRLTWVDFRRGLDDEEAFHLLVCGIRGVAPGAERERPATSRVPARSAVGRPAPKYADEETRVLTQDLGLAYRQRAELEAEGQELADVTETILDLRRRIREGGQLKAGDLLLDGRFELLEKIGTGGFAHVWKAYDEASLRVVALKVLHGQYAEDRTRCERFFRGARQMAKLSHPGVVRVFEEHCEDKPFFFFAMEYVGGGDLRQAVKAGRLSKEQIWRIILEIGEVLAHAHQTGVIHRDVKPGNILIDLDGGAKLTDFDLVRAIDTTGGTRTAGMGTFLYAAPEAMMDAKGAGQSADVYGHRVKLTQGFGLATMPVTQGQFGEFVDATGYETEKEADGKDWRDSGGPDHPVVYVSWHDAVAFCDWLSGEVNRKIRLPTEAEWEYACRAGTGGATYSPNLEEIARFGKNSGGHAHPVGQKSPNPWGLYEMLGTVWEWVADVHAEYSSDGVVVDPTGPSAGTDRVSRGGSWFSFARFVRAAFRFFVLPEIRSSDRGFRLARGQSALKQEAEPQERRSRG